MSSLFFGLDEIGATEKQPDSNYAWGLVKHAESLEFLKTHSAAWSFTFKIGARTYWRGFFATVEELEEEKSQLLLEIEYKPIRWWQFWRG